MNEKSKPHRFWTLAELRFLKQNLHLTDKELAQKLNRTEGSIDAARERYGLVKPKEAWRFQKGMTPWNKGRHYQAGGRSAETRFQKGQKPRNARPVGAVFAQKDKSGKSYLFIKLEHNRAYSYSRYVWEQHYGKKIGKGEIIVFRDGDPLNCNIDNLELITRAEGVKRNANRKKAAESLRKTWAVVHAFRDYGLTPPYKLGRKSA